jgi:DnaJ like chaperone protein
MGSFAKWITGGLGWAFFGPVGGLIGFAIGSLVDSTTFQGKLNSNDRTTPGDFALSLLVLVAAVMKADGKVLRSELEYVKQFFIQSFGAESANEAMKLLRDLLKQEIPVKDVSMQIRQRVDYSSRLQLVHFLFGIANADGMVDSKERILIEQIAQYMGINSQDINSLKSMFIRDTESAYNILEIQRTASDEEVKKAYRKMAMKYHPDKVAYLGDDFKHAAHEKFQKVNEAYESIKKERGFV